MAMLAEKKRKQKWTLNPRGNLWSEDHNKLGQKMLEKMGWSKGKGLGANLDGMKEHVKVSYKNDSSGIGFKDNAEQWTEHEDNYSKLLKSLSSNDVPIETTEQLDNGHTELKLASLENKSKVSRARVHYKKMVKGKDLSQYSEKDLANIFGKKSLQQVNVQKIEESNLEEAKSDEKDDKHSFGVSTHNGGSMLEYFQKKMKGVAKMRKVNHSDSESEAKNGFGFNGTSNLGAISEEGAPNPNISKKRKLEESCDMKESKKKKKNKQTEVEGVSNPAFDPMFGTPKITKHILTTINEDDGSGLENSPENLDNSPKINDSQDQIASSKKKNKKKKKRSQEIDPNDVSVLSAGEINGINEENLKVEETFEEPRRIKKKKKHIESEDSPVPVTANGSKSSKNEQKCVDEGLDNPCLDLNGTEDFKENSGLEVKRKNKKNKKAPNEALDNPSLDLHVNNETESNTTMEVQRKKKKKKNKEIDLNDGSSVFSAAAVEITENRDPKLSEENLEAAEFVKEAKQLKKKKKYIDANYTNATSNDSPIPVTINGSHSFEVERKAKRNCVDEGLDNPCLDLNDTEGCKENSSLEVKRKNKKIKKTLNEGLDNPSLDLDSINETGVDSNASMEVQRKKKKKKQRAELGIDNPSLNLNDSGEMNNASTENNINEEDSPKKSKKKKKKTVQAFDNPCLSLNDSEEINSTQEAIERTDLNNSKSNKVEILSDILLNVVSIPVPVIKESNESQKNNKTQRRKSVKFSNVNEERIISDETAQHVDNESDIKKELFSIGDKIIRNGLEKNGRENKLFDETAIHVEENVNSMLESIDKIQVEVENDLNEAKCQQLDNLGWIGEIGAPDGKNELLPNGFSKLKFNNVTFQPLKHYELKPESKAKASYKKHIRGDIVVEFKNSNFYAIANYPSVGSN